MPDSARKQTASTLLRIGLLSLVVNIILFAAKISLASVTGSLSLRADGIHSLIDVFASLALLAGLALSQRKSPGFPYGLYKTENLASMIIAMLLFFAGFEIITEVFEPRETHPDIGGWTLLMTAALVALPLFFSRYELAVGQRHGSPGLRADGMHFTADVLGSAVVFLSLLGESLGYPLDKAGAVIIVIFIAWSAWGLLASGMRVMLDASLSAGALEKIKSIILAEPAVSTVTNLTGRNSGRYAFVEAGVMLRLSDLKKAHMVTERLEEKIKQLMPEVDRVLIHYEPQTYKFLRLVLPLANREGGLSQKFGEAPYFIILELDRRDRSLLKQEIVVNPLRYSGQGRGIKVAGFLLSFKPDMVVSREELAGKGPGFVLADAGAEIRTTRAQTVNEMITGLELAA
jgi:cation diffusion facilitator family transporter